MQKLLVPLLFFTSGLVISWYGYYTGKLPSKGIFLGMEYDSVFISSFVVQIKFIWLFIIINTMFTLAFNLGFASYKSYIVIVAFWLGSIPVAALIFNKVVLKEPVDFAIIAGIVLITVGAMMVVAHKEVMEWIGA